MSISAHLVDFIRGAFPSVWSLELLLLLRSEPARAWSRVELVGQLRGSDHIVDQGAAALVAGGLAASEDGGTIRYAPATPEIGRLVDETAKLYAKRPDAVRRTIVFGGNATLQAFSEAFKLRGD
jgi:hypothetical protein